MANLKSDIFETRLGWIAVVVNGNGVVRSTLPSESPEKAWESALPDIDRAERDEDAVADVRAQLTAYVDGGDVDLNDVQLDLTQQSEFFKRAWAACRSIPRGSVESYGWLAQQAGSGRAIRAAGQAMARNKWALLVPCHRVVGANKHLHGFGGTNGLTLKERLLKMEGVKVNQFQVVG